MTQSTKPISPLRQRMIDDMTMRRLNPKTQAGYIRRYRTPTNHQFSYSLSSDFPLKAQARRL
jgi:hypothetical protein